MKKRFLLLMFLAAFFAPWAAFGQQPLTVYEGTTTNYYVPAYIYYFDQYSRSQFVIPATDMEELDDQTINSLTFYTSNNNVPYTTTCSVDVYLKEVNYTTINAFESKASATTVYSGYLDIVSSGNGGEMTIHFSTPYIYHGGNLLVGIENTEKGGWKQIYFYGQTVNGASVADYNSSSLESVSPTQRNFIPKTTFNQFPCVLPDFNITILDTYPNGCRASFTPDNVNQEYYKYMFTLTPETPNYSIGSVSAAYHNGYDFVHSGVAFPGNTYYLWLGYECEEDNRIYWTESPVQFTTTWPEPDTIPFMEDFHSTHDYWNVYEGLLDDVMGGTPLVAHDNGWYSNVYSYEMRTSTWSSYGSTCSYWLATPRVTMQEDCYLAFNLCLSGSDVNKTDDRFIVLASSDGGSTWSILREWNNTGSQYVYADISSNYERILMDLSAYSSGTLMVAFYSESTVNNSSNTLRIDDVSIDRIATIPFTETFDSHLMLENWNQSTGLLDDVLGGTTRLYLKSNSQSYYWIFDLSGGVFDNHASNDPNSSGEWLVMPPVLIQDDCQLVFDLALTSGTLQPVSPGGQPNARFVVVASTDFGSTWSIVREWNNTGSPYVFDNIACSAIGDFVYIDLSDYNSTDLMIAFYYESSGSNSNGRIHIDNVGIEVLPSCQTPRYVTVSDVTTQSAVISWIEVAEATAWQICLNDDEDNLIDVTTNPCTLTGLAAGTNYTVKVRANCGGSDGVSSWSNEASLTTIFIAPFLENFDSNNTPYGWAGFYGLLSNVMGGTSTLHPTTYGFYFGNVNNVFDSHAYITIFESYTYRWLLTPQIIMREDCQLTFDLALTNDSGNQQPVTVGEQPDDRFIVLASTDSGSTWTILREWNNTDSPYVYDNIANKGETVTIDLSDYSSDTLVIAFYGESTVNNSSNHLHIDYVSVDEIPNCAMPDHVTLSDITTNSVVIGWTETGEATNWQICLNGDEDNLIDAATNPYTITGLPSGTDYTVKVRANCGGSNGVSRWTPLENFSTLFSIPFVEPFDSITTPEHWNISRGLLSDVMNGAGYSDWTYGWRFNAINDVFNNHAYVNIYSTYCEYWLITPQVVMREDCQLTFDLALTKYSGTQQPVTVGEQPDDRFIVLASTDGGSTWTILREWNNTDSPYVYDNIATTGEEVTIDLSAYSSDCLMVAFYGESTVSNGDNNLHIDNVRIDLVPCAAPIDNIVSTFTATSATLNWLGVQEEYQVRYRESGGWITLIVNGNSLVLSNLTPNTTYEWQVQGLNCDGEGSYTEWSVLGSFTTLDENVKVFVTDGNWNDGDHWIPNEVPVEGNDVIIAANAVIPTGYTAVANEVTLDGGSITVADGGQLKHNTSNLEVTMQKHIDAYSDENDMGDYYLLSFPFNENVEVPAAMTSTQGYDFYTFDPTYQAAEWRNDKQIPITGVAAEQGYLYANPEALELSMTGVTYSSYDEGGVTVTINYTEGSSDIFNGWKLLGNPYTCNAYVYTLDGEDFLPVEVMMYDADGELQTFISGPVAPMQGFFVKVTETTTIYIKSDDLVTPTGAVNGKFSINEEGKQVYFSQGNLQYIGSAATPYWKFADHQWDYFAETTGQNSSDPNVDRDLFGWGTSGYDHGAICYQPWSTSQTNSDYYAYGQSTYDLYDLDGKADWGSNPISNGGDQPNQWRTLTNLEWEYLFNTRSTASGIRFAKAQVNGVNGMILLPDDWSSSYYSLNNTNVADDDYDSNIITALQWNMLEQHGAIFLPAAGHRYGTTVIGWEYNGYYKTSTHSDNNSSYCMGFGYGYMYPSANQSRNSGFAVRLVRPVQTKTTHSYIDLGLPSGTLWATCNVGAETPEDYGEYFAWGETRPKDDYTWDTYIYGNYDGDLEKGYFTKYCSDVYHGLNGYTDNLTTLLPEDDAATASWGSNWCVPTREEWQELYDNTTCIWTTQNGVNGRLFVASNGNSLFLPAAGYRNYSFPTKEGSEAFYWSSSLQTDEPYNSGVLGFGYNYCGVYDYYRHYGQSVRPVRPTRYTVTVIANHADDGIVQGGGSYHQGRTCTITATANEGFAFVNWTEDGEVVSTNATYTFTVEGNRTLVANFVSGVGGHAFVDLGLPSGLLWATCNVGADTPEGYGGYFAWGETQPKTIYGWSTYQYCNGSENTLTKYCSNPNYGYNGFTDNLTTLLPEDDAATANWGDSWRMPTQDEFQELLDNTTVTWTTQNGVNGRLFTASNGSSIFLPASGCYYDSNLNGAGSAGYYWLSSRSTGSNYLAGKCYFNSSSCYISPSSRCYGQPVRPVCFRPCSITVMANPVEGGSVQGGGSYQVGESCAVTATANEGYMFVNWTEFDDEVVSTDTTYTFTVDSHRNLVANFAPIGMINGIFSVSQGQYVRFSKGNLQYQASTDTWRFAEHQWDYLGAANGNISSTNSGWIDLFGWGTSGYDHGANCYQPWSTSTSYSDYYAYGNYQYNLYDQTGQADWGYNAISNGGNTANQWRTLTKDEWVYLFNTRSTASGIRYAKASVNGVNGVILLPDDWSTSTYSLSNTNTAYASFNSNTITATQWSTLEQAGAVFLPVAGYRYGTSVDCVGSYGNYWSASCISSGSACGVLFGDISLSTDYYDYRFYGFSVRLVRVAE